MNDPVINAPISKIVEAIEKQQHTYKWRDRCLYSISSIRTAIASLGGEGKDGNNLDNTNMPRQFLISFADWMFKNNKGIIRNPDIDLFLVNNKTKISPTTPSEREVLMGFVAHIKKYRGTEYELIYRYLAEKGGGRDEG